jgi:two-component system sensor histidine kinase ChvG
MSVEVAGRIQEEASRTRLLARLVRGLARLPAKLGLRYKFTSIAQRIVGLNVIGLVVLVTGILYLNQFRAGLIDNQRDSLFAQGQIIASAIAEKANLDWDRLSQPERYLYQFGVGAFAEDGGEPVGPSLSFILNPEQLTPLIRRTSKVTGMRMRVYDREGVLLIDSQRLYSQGQVLRFDLPPVKPEEPGVLEKAWRWIQRSITTRNLPLYKDIGAENGKAYTEVKIALTGEPAKLVSVNEKGETIVSVGIPIQRMRSVMGVLMLTSPEGDIDEIIAKERGAILSMAILVVIVTGVLSVFLAGTIAGPMHRLAYAAEQVRASIRSREPIPDYSHRSDEIGHLSRALRDMTEALYRRMDAIESFAADVAHELKNPLTSLRGAAETLPLVKSDEDRARLFSIIQHDVRRMDRLISDISNASRLDAEMAREISEPVDIAQLLRSICGILNDIHREDTPSIILKIPQMRGEDGKKRDMELIVKGHESRLSQVINNIVDNAISFSPDDGKIYITLRNVKKTREIEIAIEDEGPGIPPANLEKIFTRFYTDRPAHEEFGQNSGLGLNISQQIVTAHGGRIWAENRIHPEPGREGSTALEPGKVYGARFVIRLPAL